MKLKYQLHTFIDNCAFTRARTRRTEKLDISCEFHTLLNIQINCISWKCSFLCSGKSSYFNKISFFVNTHKFFWKKWVKTFLMSQKNGSQKIDENWIYFHNQTWYFICIQFLDAVICVISILESISWSLNFSSLGLNRFDSMTLPVWIWLLIELYISKQHFIEL